MSKDSDGDSAELVGWNAAIKVGKGAHPNTTSGEGCMRTVTVDELKRVIPAHCFKPSYAVSLFYLFRDFVAVAALGGVAWAYIPRLQMTVARYAAWCLYGYTQGLVFTGLWVRNFNVHEHVKLAEVYRSKRMSVAMAPFCPHKY